MPKQQAVRVEGIEEAQKAYQKFGEKFEKDRAKTAVDAGEALIPDIERRTRRDTGALMSGWEVEEFDKGAQFLNNMDYWTFQEFGTEDIEPMRAIMGAWEANPDSAVEVYDKSLIKAGEDAGFEQ